MAYTQCGGSVDLSSGKLLVGLSGKLIILGGYGDGGGRTLAEEEKRAPRARMLR